MRTFFTSELSIDTTSIVWARNFFRVISKDVPTDFDAGEGAYPPYSLHDEEIDVFLNATKVGSYFIPWEALALKIETDQTYAESISMSGYQQTFRSARELASDVRNRFKANMLKFYPTEVQQQIVSGGSNISTNQLKIGF
ncbi:MAG: hypothetical protein QXT97_02560 [Candidatus Diapherotrites archaeon]